MYTLNANKDTVGFSLPFSKAGNLLMLKAQVDSVEGNFILDTGNPGLVLNLTYFRNYPRTIEPDTENRGVTGNVAEVEHTVVDAFKFGLIEEFKVKAELISLSHIENAKNTKILGLIGTQFLNDCEMVIDYENNIIYFKIIPKQKAKQYKSQWLADSSKVKTFPFTIISNKIIITGIIANKKLRFVIDCAAETNILDSRLPNTIFDNLNITGKVLLTGIGSKKVEALQGDIGEIVVGNKLMNDMPFIVTNLEKTCFYVEGCVDGVLGFSFLSLQKIGFNFVTKQMYLWK